MTKQQMIKEIINWMGGDIDGLEASLNTKNYDEVKSQYEFMIEAKSWD